MVRVATWNVNGIRARQAQFLEWVEREKPDVVCLQEIKAAPDKLADELCNLAGYWCYWHGSGGYSGVSLNVRREHFPDEPRFIHPSFDRENRIVASDLGPFTVASVYVPNGGKDFEGKMDFLAELDRWAEEHERDGKPLILCGDMNVARTEMDVHPKERKPNAIGQRADERELFERLISRNLVDVARRLHPDDENLFTWWAPWRNLRQRNIGWRIDYILASREISDRIVSCEAYREVGTSDHAPLVAAIEL
ncbi:MAG: exodeoxyribonuclease III [Thermoanaerobaculia bacterium]